MGTEGHDDGRQSDRGHEGGGGVDVAKASPRVLPGPRLVTRRVGVSALPEEAWREALERTHETLVTQTPRWLRALEAATPWRGSGRLYELPGDRFLALPMVTRGVGQARVSASWPHGWGYGGVLASDGRLTRDDVEAVGADLAASAGLRIRVTPSPFTASPGTFTAARTEHRSLTQTLDLSRGMDAVWSGYSPNVRRSVRRARREGVEVRRDASGAALTDFTRLYRLSAARWARKAGRPGGLGRLQARLAEPPSMLTTVAEVLGGDMVTWTAYVEGQAAAAVVLLHGPGHTLVWRGAQDQALAAPTHANALLHHLAIEAAVVRGDGTYSFGESDPGSSLAVYKAKFGALDRNCTTSSFERLPVSAVSTGARQVLRAATSLPGRLSRKDAR